MSASSNLVLFPSTLRFGDQGEAVKEVQSILNATGYGTLVVDGIFGAQTEAAVKLFQHDYGLEVDGVVGAQTWEILLSIDYHEGIDYQSIQAVA